MKNEKTLEMIIENMECKTECDFLGLAKFLGFYNIEQMDSEEYNRFRFAKFKNANIEEMAQEIERRGGFDKVWGEYCEDYQKWEAIFKPCLNRSSFNYLAVIEKGDYFIIDGVEVLADVYHDWGVVLVHHEGRTYNDGEFEYSNLI